MIQRLFISIISILVCITASAQGVCIINGKITDTRLNSGEKIKKVFLTRSDEYGKATIVEEAKVKKGKYSFKYEIAQDEPVLLYTITGFDNNNCIELFIEPGEITINTPSAATPSKSTVSGTTTNDTYNKYKAMMNSCHEDIEREISALAANKGKEWIESSEGKRAKEKIEAKEAIKTMSQWISFLLDHNDSPMTPLEIERSLLHKLTDAYAEQMTNTISTKLHNHPYYLSLRNKMLSRNMKVGYETPNIALPLENGDTKHLADFRGKYVILNYWAPDCKKSADMIAELSNLYNVVKDNNEQFIIVSVCISNKIDEWKAAIKSNNINHSYWLHACDGLGNESPAVKLMKADKTPQIMLIEPEGKAVSFNIEIEEIAIRVEQILSGDLYYLDQEK